MSILPEQITTAITEFSKLPGIGAKSAERLVLHLLRSQKASPEALGRALIELKQHVHYCSQCFMVCSEMQCIVCSNFNRKHEQILVVEHPLDVLAFEKTGYNGVYHVLHGALSPIDGLGPEKLKMKELIERVQTQKIDELIIATNPNIEGEATARFIQNALHDNAVKITKLAHGLPMGADIEFADQVTLGQALSGRSSLR
jgi:recombination protein RecR